MRTLVEIVDGAVDGLVDDERSGDDRNSDDRNSDDPIGHDLARRLGRVWTSPGSGDGTYLVRDGKWWHYYEQERGRRGDGVRTASFGDAARYLLAANHDVLARLLPEDGRHREEARTLCRVRAGLDSQRTPWHLDDRTLFLPCLADGATPTIEAVVDGVDVDPTSVRPAKGPTSRVEWRLPTEGGPTMAIERVRDAFVLPVAIVTTAAEAMTLPAPGVRWSTDDESQ